MPVVLTARGFYPDAMFHSNSQSLFCDAILSTIYMLQHEILSKAWLGFLQYGI